MLFEFRKKDIVYARKCTNEGAWVNVVVDGKEKRKKIKLNEWYVVEWDVKSIVSDKHFKAHYEPLNSEASLHLERPERRFGGVM